MSGRLIKPKRGSALILAVTVMTVVLMIASASLNLSGYGRAATSSAALNANGYALAEGGVINAERLLNKILYARFYPVSERALEILKPDAFALNANNDLFKMVFGGLMDGEAENYFGAPYVYVINLNDNYETQYRISVSVKLSGGGFDVTSSALNIQTGVTDTAAGRIEFAYEPGAETADFVSSGGYPELESLSVEGADCFRYEIKSVKKAFE